MAYAGSRRFIYTASGGDFFFLRFIDCGDCRGNPHVAASKRADKTATSVVPNLYFHHSRHADVGADFHYFLRFAGSGHYAGTFPEETVRAAILAIPKGQWEASYAIGMNYTQAFLRTVMPQALRISVPSLSNTFISTVKDTSLASLVLVTELFRVAQNITAVNYEFILIYSEAALIYWIFCFILSFAQDRLEARLSRHL